MDNNKNSQKIIRIGCSSAAWGDTFQGVTQLLSGNQIDYLVGDYLAEVTMAILSRMKAKNPEGGFVPDWALSVQPHLAEIKQKGIKLITNAGGLNPFGCRDDFLKMAKDAGLDFNVAVITGDDLMHQLDDFNQLPADMASMNAYLGARSIKEALSRGADVVITGRSVDTAVVLGPLMHEFDWSPTDYDKLAAGSLAGHIIECGCQATGGLFTDWQDVCEDWDNMGFPIIECSADGSFIVTKAENTGGLVSIGTVSEQIVYEIGDPAAYLLPDVTCDFTDVTVTQAGNNRVHVSGARGRPPPDGYKVCGTYQDGFKLMTTYMVAGWQAGAKARKAAEKLVERVAQQIKAKGFGPYGEVSIEVIGAEDTYGDRTKDWSAREVVVKIGLRHNDARALHMFAAEFAIPAVSMAQGFTGVFGGRPVPKPVIRVHSFLIDKARVVVSLNLDGDEISIDCTTPETTTTLPENAKITPAHMEDELTEVPLRAIAWGRSGDKGNHANIGLIARRVEFAPYLKAQVTAGVIEEFFKHYLEGRVTGYDLPGMNALNFLLEDVLGGGGSASLRYDPQAKTYAQMLLDIPVKVPAKWLTKGGYLENYGV